MSFIQIGELVRIYYEDNSFDEGEVRSVTNETVVVDFYDWWEQWDSGDFGLTELFYEGIEVLVPKRRGIIIANFNARNASEE